MKFFYFRALLQSSGWLSPAYVGVNDSGNIQYLSDKEPAQPTALEFVNGFALPGFQNAHSHAFQRVLRARTERLSAGLSSSR